AEVLYEFVYPPAEARADVRKDLGIPDDAFVAGACAAIELRKGADLFLKIASAAAKRSPEIYFLWVGGRFQGTAAMFAELQRTISENNLGRTVIFVDPKYDLAEYYRAMDVFLLPSREDPFPLVCLDAAAVAKPVICFESAGGMSEFVRGECGFAVPYLDTVAFAEKIIAFYEDRELLRAFGENAASKVRREYSSDVVAPRILAAIDSVDQTRFPIAKTLTSASPAIKPPM
ncbi:MAG: glycosyltransferase family 4 protein, partial [Pyrinomonadaceae bacterium]